MNIDWAHVLSRITPTDLTDYLNLLVLFVALLGTITSWFVYSITRANGIGVIALGMMLGVIARILIYIGLMEYSAYISLLSWISLGFGVYMILKIMRRMT